MRLWSCLRNKHWLRLSLLRRQSDNAEGEVPVDCCQLQVGVHTAPSHWYSVWPDLSCCSVLHWELRIEWQQGMYVRNKQWLRLPLLRRQCDHTEGEVPVSFSVTGWCSHGSFSLVFFVARSVVLFVSPLGDSDRIAAGNICPVIIALRAESTSICPLTALAKA